MLVVAIVGATAAGKSGLALDLAAAWGGEIVNTDSMQIYRGMDIGTAKLPRNERRGIPHHLLDLVDPDQPVTVAEFQQWAREVIADCHSRTVIPILVGGSALYTRAIVDEFEFPGTDPELRAKYEQQLEEVGAAGLHASLAAIDPAAAEQILPSNGRRIVRALEVIELTGQPFTASLPRPTYYYPGALQIGVDIERDLLDLRIESRVEQMWADGFVAEVEAIEGELRRGRTANRALGYQQILKMLDGEITEAEAKELTIIGTRRFARRQDSWFRKDQRVAWMPHDALDKVALAQRLLPTPSSEE